jgi:hypothetical protein
MNVVNVLKGLLSSRKFWAALVGVLAIVLVQCGVSEEKANTISVAIMTLVGLYIGGTAVEDAANKLAKCIPLLLMAAPLVGGCSFFTPGLDARTATEARSETSWDQNSNLRLSENTTHNRRVVMAESGEGEVAAEYYDSGIPKSVKGASQLLSQVSEPHDVTTLMVQRDLANLQAFAELTATVKQLAAIAAPLVQQQIEIKAANDADRAAFKREVIAAIREAVSRPAD